MYFLSLVSLVNLVSLVSLVCLEIAHGLGVSSIIALFLKIFARNVFIIVPFYG